ncbi:MAG: hypothetical protein IKE34_02075, partial [Paenibacillus sp.]|nr:hypothetical protein [Paenibacillus sp.]
LGSLYSKSYKQSDHIGKKDRLSSILGLKSLMGYEKCGWRGLAETYLQFAAVLAYFCILSRVGTD